MPPQWYQIRIRPKGVTIRARDEQGLRYAAVTMTQLLAANRRAIPAMDIEDWPDFPVRGVLLDVSRDKVPKLSTLFDLIDRLALWKINQLQLYIEHTFAYRGHEKVWRGCSPLTPAQIRRLDRHCRLRGIDLVPNQNSFGHMEHWLRHHEYSHLAETNGLWKTPFGTIRDKPATLNPLNPESLKLVADLYRQLLPNFSSRLFNVNCDETFELGQGRSKTVCARRGVGNVYVDYLRKLHGLVRRHGGHMMYWSDIVHQYPAVIPRLPKDSVALIWGYEADHPFEKQCRQLSRAGLSFYVCPGTSSWCSIAGRTTNAMKNLLGAAHSGRRHGAEGYLITDWGDLGHRQYLPASYPGLLYGAAVSWCAKTNSEIDLGAAVSRHAFDPSHGDAGRLWVDAGMVHELSGVYVKNRSVLFNVLQQPLQDSSAAHSLSGDAIQRMLREITRIEKGARRLKPAVGDAGNRLAQAELINTLAILRHACVRAQAAQAFKKGRSSAAARRQLAADLRSIMREHRKLWLARNCPGGLPRSMAHYEKMLKEYEGRPAI